MQMTSIHVTQYQVSPDLSAVAKLRPLFIDFLLSLGITDPEKEGWKLVFTELLNNAIEHGCRDCAGGKIKVEWYQTRNQVFLCLQHPGSGPDDALLEAPQLPEDPLAEGGRGLFIIHSFVEDWKWLRGKSGFELSVWKSYAHLNYTLPVNQEAEAILDELSDCYENLTLFHRLAEALKQGLSFDQLVAETITLFIEAGSYDLAHVEILGESNLPELNRLRGLGFHHSLQSMAGLFASAPDSHEGITWTTATPGNPLTQKGRHTTSGCAVPIFERRRKVALLAVANRSDEKNFMARDIRNLQSLAEIIGVALTRTVMDRENTAHRIVEHEFDLAKQLQRQLLGHQQRSTRERGYQVVTQCIPAFDMAGDHAEFLFDDKGELFFAIIDVMGKGVSAAILAGIFRSHFLAWSLHPEDPGSFLRKVSNSLESQLSGRVLFITAFVGRLQTSTGMLHCAGAGHPPLLLLPSAATETVAISSEGPPLGVVRDFPYTAEHLYLQYGDTLIGLTDGFYEWKDPTGQMFGWDPLVNFITSRQGSSPEAMASDLFNLLHSQSCNSEQDDRTLLILNRCQP